MCMHMCVCVCIYIDNLGHIMAHHHDDNIDVNVVVVISKAMDPARKPPLCVCVCVCVEEILKSE